MGSFMATPAGQAEQQPPSAMSSLMGPQSQPQPPQAQLPQSPQAAEAQAQAGSLEMMRQMELALGTLSQMGQQVAAAYPGGAEPARVYMQSLEQARQALLSMLVPMMSGLPDAQPQGPAFMG